MHVSNGSLTSANLRDDPNTAVGNESRRFIFVCQYGNMGRTMSCTMASTPKEPRHPAMERARTGEVGSKNRERRKYGNLRAKERPMHA